MAIVLEFIFNFQSQFQSPILTKTKIAFGNLNAIDAAILFIVESKY